MTRTAPPQSRSALRAFGLMTGAIFAGLFGVLFPWLLGHRPPWWPWALAGTLWIWALALPSSLRPVYRGCMAMGGALGWINTRIILTLLFYAVFFPLGLAMRVAGRDPLKKNIDKSRDSYRVQSRTRSPNHMERPF